VRLLFRQGIFLDPGSGAGIFTTNGGRVLPGQDTGNALMRKQIRWTEKTADGGKKDIRVSFHGREIKWQFQRSDMRCWDYDTPPTPEEWDALEQRLKARYRRGHVALDKILALVHRRRGA
jgi:hypothetical protein